MIDATPSAFVAATQLPAIAVTQAVHQPHTPRALDTGTQAIVLHATCGSEGKRSAEACAAMFQDPALTPPRSCHFVVDTDSIVNCVDENFVAWHCGHNGNARSIGIELCGLASQTRAQWLDANSLPMLQLAARLVATLCKRFALPVALIDGNGLRRGDRGITTHDFIRQAWPKDTNHTDPGSGFPLADFIAAVRVAS
jgi:N-acetyl-anhydromuramyl-L-alanine amidase AmpD